MKYWFFLSDPESYHFDQLFKTKRDVWDGVYGGLAQKYLGEIRTGDRIIGYHTAPEKQVVATLEAVSDAHQNPALKDKKNWVVDVRAVAKLARPVPLAELKAHKQLSQMKLFKMARPIAVSPITEEEYAEIVRLGQA
jgi:predicted RNA-binding protein with PUA-like domain